MSRSRRRIVKACRSKRRWATYADAVRAILADPRLVQPQVYRCRACAGYHVTRGIRAGSVVDTGPPKG